MRREGKREGGHGVRREEGVGAKEIRKEERKKREERWGEWLCLLLVLHIFSVTSLVASSANTQHSSPVAAGADTHDTQHLSSAMVASYPDSFVRR